VIAGWLVAAAALILTAPPLSDITNADQSAFLPDRAESARAAALAARAFPDQTGASAVVVVRRADSTGLTDADVAAIGAVAQRLNIDRPAAVRGIAFDPARAVSPDRSVAVLTAGFSGAPEEPSVRAAVGELRGDAAEALRGTGLAVGVTGQAAINADAATSLARAEKVVTAVTVGLILALLLLIFRSPIAAVLPLLTVGLVYGVATAAVSWLGSALHVEVGQELPTMLIVVLFGIGTDYVLFLLFRYRERLRAGDAPRDAIVGAVERVGGAIGSAAAAVIAAFGALVLAALGFFATLGPALAVAVAVMLAAALTLVPAVVTVLGRRLFWPTRRARVAEPSRPSRLASVGRLVAGRPVLVIALGLTLLGGAAAGLVRLSPDYDPIAAQPAGTESARAYADLQRGFPAGALAPTEIYLTGDRPLTQAEIGAFTQRLAGVRGVAMPLAPRLSADARTAEMGVILASEPYAPAAMDLVEGPLREAARAAAPAGTAVLVGGETMALADVRSTTNRDLAVIFPVAAALFALILAALLRALLTPLLLVALVVLGFAATLGASALVFSVLPGTTGLAFTIPIILYLFVTAIGTDYNILMTARLREELRDGRSPRQAAALAVEHAGPSVAAAAAILAGTFAALLISGVPFFVQIGFAVTLGIALVAFVVSILLVPAVAALLKPRDTSRARRATLGVPHDTDLDGALRPAGDRRRP
jgi:RND superfamily putative drug exporter